MCAKEISFNQRDTVSFKSKKKGAKPVQTKGVCLFSITGEDFNSEKLIETLQSLGASKLE